MKKTNTPMVIEDEPDKPNAQMMKDIRTMLTAAVFMPEKAGQAHVTAQSGVIFDQYEPMLSAEEFALTQAQNRYDEITTLIKEKRKERGNLSRFVNDNTPPEIGDKDNAKQK